MSSPLKKIRKKIEANQPKPVIIFLPDDKFDPLGKETITVTDPKLYEKLHETMKIAIENERPNVVVTPAATVIKPEQRIIWTPNRGEAP